MSGLATRAEVTKLAALLGTSVEELSYLEDYPAQALRELRGQLTEQLFESDRKRLVGIASATKLVPTALSARIAEKTFPAPLAARVAGLLEPARAVDLARKVSVSFLADMTPYLDPRRISGILARMPADIVVSVGKILGDSGEYISMGRFVGHLDTAAINQTVAVLSDSELLRIGFVLEDPDVLPDMVRLLPPDRLRGVVRAAYEEKLWPEALNLLDHLDEATRGHIADVAAGEEDAVLDGMVDTAHTEDLWDIALPVARSMNPQSRQRFAALASFRTPEVLDKVVRTAAEKELWAELLPLVPLLPADARKQVARIAADLGDEVLEKVLAQAGEHELWAPLVVVASDLGPDLPWNMTDIIAKLDERELETVVVAAHEQNLWETALLLVRSMSPETRRTFAGLSAFHDPDVITRVVKAAAENELWPELLPLVPLLPIAAAMGDDVPWDSLPWDIGEIVADMGEIEMDAFLNNIADADLWGDVLAVAERVPDEHVARLARQAVALDVDAIMTRVIAAADATGRWAQGLGLLGRLDEATLHELVPHAAALAPELRARVTDEATKLGLLDSLGPIAAAVSSP